MANQVIPTISAVTIGDTGDIKSTDGKEQYSVAYIDYFKNKFDANGLTKFMAAPTNSVEQVAAGTALYYVTKGINPKNSDGGKVNDTNSVRSVAINIDQDKEISTVISPFDVKKNGGHFEGSNVTIGNAFLDAFIFNLKARQEANISAYVMNTLVTQAKKSVTTFNVTDPDALTTADANLIYQQIQDIANGLRSTIDDEVLGISETQIYIIASLKGMKYLNVLLTGLNASNEAFDVLVKNRIKEIRGLNVIEATFLGNSYAKGKLDQDVAFDFSGLDFIIAVEKTIAVPWVNVVPLTTILLPTDRSIKNFASWSISNGKALYPQLIKGLTIGKKPNA